MTLEQRVEILEREICVLHHETIELVKSNDYNKEKLKTAMSQAVNGWLLSFNQS